MTRKRPRVPIGLPIAAVITFILGYFVAEPLIRSSFSEERLATNVLLSAIPFVLIFVSIILTFITIIWFIASMLNHNIPMRIYRPIELAIIAGIVLGIFGMFQPWSFAAYRLGFFLLFGSTLAFILWSHVVPRGVHHENLGSVSISDFEQKDAQG